MKTDFTLADLGFPATQLPPAKNNSSGKLARGTTTSIEERALQLLGSGISVEVSANALGVTASRISQLLSEEQFADKVAILRYENLQKHNLRDTKYDNIEDRLLEKLEQNLAFLLKPQDILRAITVINNAKRRGQAAPEQVVNQQNVVTVSLPTTIIEKFTVNVNNQVIKAGDQGLHTISSGDLLKTVDNVDNVDNKELCAELCAENTKLEVRT